MEHVTTLHLSQCGSTQDEARRLLAHSDAGRVVTVTAERQLAGHGRHGRRWDEPPGAAIFASVGARGPLAVSVLEDLPHHIARLVLDAAWSGPGIELSWKSPNDIVAPGTGAKVGGVLVDARSQGSVVLELIVGVGINVAGPSFVTSDGRQATTLEAIAGTIVDLEALRSTITLAIGERISERR